MLAAALFATATGLAGSLFVARDAFAAGFALLGLSVLSLRWPVSIWGDEAIAELPPWARRLGLLAVCAVGVGFRFYQLNPPGLWGDDAINGLLAFDILDGRIRSPLQIVPHAHSNFHALSNYPIAAAFWLFGPDLTTLRLPSAVASALCVPLLYGAAAPLFGARVALLAALFFATSPPQLSHSKQLIQVVMGELFQIAGICLLVRGVAAGRRWQTALAGLPLALCCYTYHAARIAPLVAIVFAVAVWWRDGAPVRRCAGAPVAKSDTGAPAHPRTGALLLWAAIVFVIALLPLIVAAVRDPSALFGRVEATSIIPEIRNQGLAPLWEAAWRTLLMFHYRQGPEYHWFGIGFDPAFNALLGFLMLHGLVQSLRHWREPRHLLLLAWLAIGLVPGVLSSGAPRLYRALLSTPPLYVWAALPIVQLVILPMRPLVGRAVRGLALLLVLAVPAIDFNYYFYRVYTHPVFHWFQGERIVEMARTLRARGPGWVGYLLSDTFDAHHETFAFLSRCWGLDIRNVGSLTEVVPLSELPENGALFMMTEANLGAAAAIAARYPGGELSLRSEPTLRSWALDDWWPLGSWPERARTVAGFYPVPRAAAERPTDQPRGLDAEYTGTRTMTRQEPYPFYYFFPDTFPGPFTMRWHGRVTVPDGAGRILFPEINGRWTAWINGRRMRNRELLPIGTHELRLEARALPSRARLRLYWAAPDQPQELIPPSAFSPP